MLVLRNAKLSGNRLVPCALQGLHTPAPGFGLPLPQDRLPVSAQWQATQAHALLLLCVTSLKFLRWTVLRWRVCVASVTHGALTLQRCCAGRAFAAQRSRWR